MVWHPPQYGETALHLAAWVGNVAIGEQLLEAGADPDIRERVRKICNEVSRIIVLDNAEN